MSTVLEAKLTDYVSTLSVETWGLPHRDPSIWGEAIRKTFQKQVLSQELLSQLAQECLEQPVDTQQEYLLFCQRIFSLSLLYRYSQYSFLDTKKALVSLYLKVLRNQYPQGFQLVTLYKEWIAFFLEEYAEPVGMHLNSQGIALVEYQGHESRLHLPHLMQNAELALLSGLFALMTDNRELLGKALTTSLWLSDFIEEGQGFFEGLWMKEQEFCLDKLSFIHALLFQFSALMTADTNIQEACHAATKLFTRIPLHNLGELYPLLYLLMLEVTEQHSHLAVSWNQDQAELKKKSAKYLGYATYRYQDFSCYCSVSGAGSGCAGFSKGAARIVSAGPHLGSLGDMHQYGIYRTPLMQNTPFKDVLIEQKEGSLSFAGWTGIVAGHCDQSKPGTSWLRLEMSVKEKKAVLGIKRINFQENQELFFVFFVKGRKAIIDKNCHLHPDTLDRYQGKATEMSIQDMPCSLTIKTPAAHLIQVIPLAGDTYFWGAQFLVAYAFPQNETLLFEIS
jgi:hypothetical protein